MTSIQTQNSIAATRGSTIYPQTTGVVVYESTLGHRPGFDHFIISVRLINLFGFPGNGHMQLYVPSVITSDAGSYYCTYYDGSSLTAAVGSFTSSLPFNLSVTTKSSQSASRSKYTILQYSGVLLSSMKIIM